MGRETSEVSKTATVTLVGCLQREQDVPGKEPNVAERAGIGEDFILTNASPKGEDTESKDSQEAVGTSGTIASTGAQKMFKIEGLDDEQLRDYIGKRVEVTGRLDDDAASPEVGTSGNAEGSGQYEKPNRDKLPKIDAASIRPAAGNCPAGR
jgi:hypothetical protein